MTTTQRPIIRRRPRAFVLLEVIVSLAILGFAVAALMRSFTQSLSASRTMEVQTQAMFLADQLIHELEITPPEEGRKEGGFGDDYRNYSYFLEVKYVEPRYKGIRKVGDIDQYFATREIHIEILYNDGKNKIWAPIKLDSAVTGFEKFSFESKQSYMNF